MRQILVSLIAVCVLALPAATQPKPQKRELNLGMVLALTGAASAHGESIRKAATLAVEDLRAQGWTVNVAVEDDNTNPAKTISALKALLSKGMKLFIGPTWSFQIQSAVPILEKADALAFAPACDSTNAGGPSKALFFGMPNVTKKKPLIARWLRDHDIKSAAVVYAESTWGQIHEKVFREALEDTGIPLVGIEKFEYGAEAGAIPGLLARLKAKNPEVIFSTSSKEAMAIMYRRMHEQKFSSMILGMDDLLDAFTTGLLSRDLREPRAFSLQATPRGDLDAKYRARYGEDPYQYAESAYDSVMLLAEATMRSDGSVAGIRRFLQEMSGYAGVAGNWKFDRDGNPENFEYRIRPAN